MGRSEFDYVPAIDDHRASQEFLRLLTKINACRAFGRHVLNLSAKRERKMSGSNIKGPWGRVPPLHVDVLIVGAGKDAFPRIDLREAEFVYDGEFPATSARTGTEITA